MIGLASPEQRRAHAYALKHRTKHRARYAVVTAAIRATKQQIAATNRCATHEAELHVRLRALRLLAWAEMQIRDEIKQRLRDTAYTYASREEVAAAQRPQTIDGVVVVSRQVA